jgi:hypothetical protein
MSDSILASQSSTNLKPTAMQSTINNVANNKATAHQAPIVFQATIAIMLNGNDTRKYPNVLRIFNFDEEDFFNGRPQGSILLNSQP